MIAGAFRSKPIRDRWMIRFLVSVCIALCIVVFDRAKDCAADSGTGCVSPRLLVALSGHGGYPAASEELWGDADLLAYDLMTKTWVDGLQQEAKLNAISISLGEALHRLHLAFPETRVVPSLEYRKLALTVQFEQQIQDSLEALLPSPRPNAVRLVKLPGPLSEALSGFCERLCECWVQVDTNATARMYFPRSVNLIFALRQLRTYPDIKSVGLLKATLPHLTRESPSWQNLSVENVSGDYYFTLTTLRLDQVTERKFYIVTPMQVRLLDPSEAANILAFERPSLPADVWP